ncbi:type II secretion system F family protein [Ideonella sp. BN130291]|uniref:type II secretion system F family protein n=1 Tax=Ideonella sp. BN130291 TaxID=3112940 RepID=UPI002E2648CC|nr:type II secretion system F family protein [Ideonella sp. BN130291]
MTVRRVDRATTPTSRIERAVEFQVRLFDAAAAAVREERAEGDSAAAVTERLQRGGMVVLSVAEVATASHATAKLDVAWWCRELRTLLGAGMTVVEALETLNAQSLGRARAQVHGTLVAQLRQGRPLSAAMQAAACFPAVLVAGVKASERTSSLVEALDDYLRYDEMLERLRKQVVSAAIYPAVVVALGGVITLFLLLFVMPRFSAMYSDLRGSVSGATALLIGLSKALNGHGGWVALALAGVALLVLALWRSGFWARVVQTALERIAPLQRQLDEFRLAKLYHSLALMFRGGYALDDALGQCAGLGLGERLRAGIGSAQQALNRGQRVSTAFADAGLTDAVTQRLLAVGERTGNFDKVLQTIAERHSGHFSTFIERATRIVEPLLLLLVALVVGGIVVMMYMPVFDMASSIR